MHGLINKAIEMFLAETYGSTAWDDVVSRAGLPFDQFEAMLRYEDALTDDVLMAAQDVTGRERDALLEDMGTFLVTSPTLPAVRRLLRFGGVTYADFLHSLEELADRVQLAVDDLGLPPVTVADLGDGQFDLICGSSLPGYEHVLTGVLRAMADDYGALVLIDVAPGASNAHTKVSLSLVQDGFSAGKSFALGARSA